MTLKETMTIHEGEYSCKAVNKFGEARILCLLLIADLIEQSEVTDTSTGISGNPPEFHTPLQNIQVCYDNALNFAYQYLFYIFSVLVAISDFLFRWKKVNQ